MDTTAKPIEQKKDRNPAESADIVIQKVFGLPVSKVWQAWTEPEFFQRWWGPKDYTCPSSSIEARVGGTYLNCMRGPDGKEFWSTGVVKEFVPEEKLVITDSFADEKGNVKSPSDYGMAGNWPDELLITVTMEEADGATKLRMLHEGIPSEMRDECIRSWNESLDKLEKNME